MDVCESSPTICAWSAAAIAIPINIYLAIRTTLELRDSNIKFPSKSLAVFSYGGINILRNHGRRDQFFLSEFCDYVIILGGTQVKICCKMHVENAQKSEQK